MGQVKYARHRKVKYGAILEAAETLFIKNGIQHTTLAEIADAANMTRPTIYNYFKSKENLVGEIFKGIAVSWVSRNEGNVWQRPGTGLDVVSYFLRFHIEQQFKNINEAKFVAEFDYMFSQQWESIDDLSEAKEILDADAEQLLQVIKRGYSDGSIKFDKEPDFLAASIFTFLSGLSNQLASLGPLENKEYKFEKEKIIFELIEIFINGLRPERTH